MDATSVVWTIGLPLLLFFIAVAAGTAFAITNSDSVGFLIAKASLAAASFDLVAVAIYWVIATRQPLPWNIAIPTIAGLVAIPVLVLSLQGVENLQMRLSTRLFPGDAPTPPLPAMPREIPKNALKVFLGSNVAWGTRMPHTILMMAGEKMIEIDKVKSRNELVVTTLKIFDDRNNIIARIDEDGFWVENSTRKKRPNPSTLVVYDHSDAEVLRIVFMNPDTIYVTGIFRHAGIPRPVIVTPQFMDSGGLRISNSAIGDSGIADIAVGGH